MFWSDIQASFGIGKDERFLKDLTTPYKSEKVSYYHIVGSIERLIRCPNRYFNIVNGTFQHYNKI